MLVSKRASRLAAVTALACGLLLPTARESAFDTVKAVMYEVTETLVLKPTANPNDGDAIARRMADASLLGNDVQVTGTGIPAAQFVVADAKSNVNLVPTSASFGTGPVNGTVFLLTDIDPTRNSLDTLLVVGELKIKGTIDLGPLLIPDNPATPGPDALPVAYISGKWKSQTLNLRGTFDGFFAVAFPLGPDSYGYLALPGACASGSQNLGQVCTLTSQEFLLGVPLTKAVVTFTSTGSLHNGGNDDDDND